MSATMKRFQQGQSRPDLFSHFVQEDGRLQPDMTMKDLDAEVRSMILAGEPCFAYHPDSWMANIYRFSRRRYICHNTDVHL